jgi:hypothetical protein
MGRLDLFTKSTVRAAFASGMLGLMSSGNAGADTAEGTITNLYQRVTDGLVIIYLSGAVSGRPACASATTYWMVK